MRFDGKVPVCTYLYHSMELQICVRAHYNGSRVLYLTATNGKFRLRKNRRRRQKCSCFGFYPVDQDGNPVPLTTATDLEELQPDDCPLLQWLSPEKALEEIERIEAERIERERIAETKRKKRRKAAWAERLSNSPSGNGKHKSAAEALERREGKRRVKIRADRGRQKHEMKMIARH